MAQRSAAQNPRRRSLPVASDPLPADCTTCGQCCFSGDLSYIGVFEVDRRRMNEAELGLTVLRGDARFMRFEQGRCVALRIADGRHTCEIYEDRPDACRALERGSGMCRSFLTSG